MKRIFTTACLIITGCIANAQCTTGVAALTGGGGCAGTTYAYSTVQTFQPACGGILKNVTAPNISVFSDDLRGSGYAVTARMRASSGALIATSSTVTDQWYPGATATFDFTCANLSLSAGTTYQLEFFQTINPALPAPNPAIYQLVLFCRSNASVYAGGNYIADGTAYPAQDLYGWSVNLANGSIAAASSNATQTLTSPSCNIFYNSSNEAIAQVQPTGAAMGSTTAKVFIQSSASSFNAQPYVRRHYDIAPSTNASSATATITLYFSQADFTDYNSNRGSYPALPADTTDAANNKANLRITQQHGTSSTGAPGSYTGWNTANGPANRLITPASVSWNSAVSRWEVTFPVTGFSGFFAHTGAATPLPVKLLDFTAKAGGAVNLIAWHTGAEDGGATFEVARSSDGRTFGNIGLIAGKGSNSSYSFADEQPYSGTAYYRLKATGAGSEVAYSAIAAVIRTDQQGGSIALSPVPAHNSINITNTDAALNGRTASVYDLQGRVMTTFTLSRSSQVDISSWAPGSYLLKLPSDRILRVTKQ